MALLGALLWPADAAGRSEGRVAYTKGQTYSAALRYLRVDLGYEVVERDPEAAYLIFLYQPPGRRESTSGAIEIVDHPDAVRILVQLPKLPGYHERVLRDGLLRKLRDEYGTPAVRPRAPARTKNREGSSDQREAASPAFGSLLPAANLPVRKRTE